MATKVLYIEDESFLRELATTKLTQAGYEMYSAVDGEEGLARAAQIMPDVILLDIILPGMSGYDVLHKLQSSPSVSQIPVIMLTNLGSKTDIAEGAKRGAVDYIIKASMTPNDIIKKIEKVLQRKN